MKKLLLFILPIFFVALIYSLKYTKEKVEVPFDINATLKQKATKEYLEKNIANELKNRNFEEAKALIDLADYLKVDINSSLKDKYLKENSGVEGFINKSEDFLRGFISGNVNSSSSMAGSISSDFTVVGDIRDIYKEGGAYLEGKSYDRYILSLSIIGVALTGTTMLSLGTTTPLKVATSTLKSAKKAKYLTDSFATLLGKKLSESVDLKLLKTIDISSFKSIKKAPSTIKKSVKLKPIEAILKNIATIKKNSSLVDTIKILKYIDNEDDLKKAVKISNKYKKNSYSIFKVLGKSALRGSKFVIKKTIKYFMTIAAIIITALLWLILFFKFINSTIRRFYN